MKREIKAPSVGESITEVRVGKWVKQNGEAAKAGEVLLEIESDKATVEVAAEYAGVVSISHNTGDTVRIGEVLGYVDENGTATASAPKASSNATVAAGPATIATGNMPLSPSVRRAVTESGIDPAQVPGTGRGGRITKGDVIAYQEGGTTTPRQAPSAPTPAAQTPTQTDGRERRVPLTLLRQRIAERLVMAQHTAAILTTFNECDMTAVMELRNKHKESFKAKYGVGLSFMSFFTRACVRGLQEVQAVNAMIDGKEIVYRDYQDVGVAVGTDRGLVVPVLRDAGRMSFVEIEKGIGALALRARDGKLSIAELQGGTFTISNGGTYGSLLSTPILNPPQSGILGMHKIQERPMAVNGQVVIRPMMYLALSYDHRIIDGKEAVTFLIKVKEGIENPTTLGLDF